MYKGGGKDPILLDSYRGVMLSSVIAKVLQFLFLVRLQPLLSEANIPQVNLLPLWKHRGFSMRTYWMQYVLGLEVFFFLYLVRPVRSLLE